jgi:hypothetical protein
VIIFAAELSKKTGVNPVSSTPSNGAPRIYNVYELCTGPVPEDSYWTGWGGWYDNIDARQVEIYFSRYLVQVFTMDEVCRDDYTYYAEGGYVYFNLPKHPWLYTESQAALREINAFLSGPPRPDDPSDDTIDGARREVRLETPSVSVKLSDVISGLVKYSTFSFTLFNDDGRFDNFDSLNFFNSPAYIKKSWVENPVGNDFIPIRSGLVEDISVNDRTIVINCADKFRSLEEPVCRIITKEMFPYDKDGVTGKEMPVLYGRGEIALTEIEKTVNGAAAAYKYVILCEYVEAVINLYTDEGEVIPDEGYTVTDGVITLEVPGGGKAAKYALISGYGGNTVGRIIVDLIEKKSGITWGPSAWDQEEVENYFEDSPR